MTKAEAGKLGGRATVKKYGRGHMSKIGRKGAAVFWAKYTLSPIGTSNFAIVNRETRIIVAYTNGGQYVQGQS